MSAPSTGDDLLALVRKSGLVESHRLDAWVERFGHSPASVGAKKLARYLGRRGLLTHLQALQLLRGKHRGFSLGGYLLLERLGRQGVSSVFLCRRQSSGRRVAVKLLPVRRSAHARAVADAYHRLRADAPVPRHPNLVRVRDLVGDGRLLLLVREYVDGRNLEEVVGASGPLSVDRAVHYARQAATALHHLHGLGLVHHDVNPGTLLLDRRGTVRILDPGLAGFLFEHRALLRLQGEKASILGTADYLAPEQALAGSAADFRADLYGLGATLYFLLTGRQPFPQGNALQKLLFHQVKEPTPIRELRADVPETLAGVISRMMAKDPAGRYADAAAVAEALAPFAPASIAPPPDEEMPRLCRAARYDGLPAPEPAATPPAAPEQVGAPALPGPESVAAAALPVPDLVVTPDVSAPKRNADAISVVETADFPLTPAGPEPTADAPAVESDHGAESGEAGEAPASPDPLPEPSPSATTTAAHIPEWDWPALGPAEAETKAPDSAPEQGSAAPPPEPEDTQEPSRPTHEPFAEEPSAPPAFPREPDRLTGESGGDTAPLAPVRGPGVGEKVRGGRRRTKARSKPTPAPEAESAESAPARKRPPVPEKRPDKAAVARAGSDRARPFPPPRAPETGPEPKDSSPEIEESSDDKPAPPAPRPTPHRGRKDQGLLPVVVIGCVVLCAVALGAANLFNRGAGEKKGESAPSLEISGEQLLHDFQEDELAANQKYYNKVVEVRGVVSQITEESVALRVNKLARGMVYCRLSEKDAETVSSLKQGETLIVKGICNGVPTFVPGVEVRNCEFRK